MKETDIKKLESYSVTVRKDIIEMSRSCLTAAHPGPALSCTDIVTALYFGFMNIDPNAPEKEDRDRLILSKGHACPAQYASLAELGFFDKSEFKNLRHPGALLQGHPTYHKTPGVDMTAGSLGNGLGIGLGMAYYLKLKGFESRVYVVLGDGELNEGTIWEAVMYAPQAKVNNLIVFVDVNRFQSCGACNDIMPMPFIRANWESFGWNALEINGNDMKQIVNAVNLAHSSIAKPTVIIANTVKGKGVSFMENNNSWHQHKVSEEQYNIAMKELENAI